MSNLVKSEPLINLPIIEGFNACIVLQTLKKDLTTSKTIHLFNSQESRNQLKMPIDIAEWLNSKVGSIAVQDSESMGYKSRYYYLDANGAWKLILDWSPVKI